MIINLSCIKRKEKKRQRVKVDWNFKMKVKKECEMNIGIIKCEMEFDDMSMVRAQFEKNT